MLIRCVKVLLLSFGAAVPYARFMKEFDLWTNKFALYQLPTFKKNEIFYYDKIFITTQENLPYQTIMR